MAVGDEFAFVLLRVSIALACFTQGHKVMWTIRNEVISIEQKYFYMQQLIRKYIRSPRKPMLLHRWFDDSDSERLKIWNSQSWNSTKIAVFPGYCLDLFWWNALRAFHTSAAGRGLGEWPRLVKRFLTEQFAYRFKLHLLRPLLNVCDIVLQVGSLFAHLRCLAFYLALDHFFTWEDIICLGLQEIGIR